MKILTLIAVFILSLVSVTFAVTNGIYVMDDGALAGGNDAAVIHFLLTDNGNATPNTRITGANTGWSSTGNGTTGICINPAHTQIWTTDQVNNKLSEFLITDTGNVTPQKTFSGASTTLNRPAACYFNPSGDIWIANISGNNMLRYASATLGGAGGNVAPDTTFTNAAMSNPSAVATDSSGNIYVGDFASSACSGNDCFAFLFPSNASGTTAFTAEWSWQKSTGHVKGVSKGGNGKFYMSISPEFCAATSTNLGGIAIYNNPNTSTSAAPDAQICGATALPSNGSGVQGIDTDSNGDIVLANTSTPISISEWNVGHTGNVAPDKNITGVNTQLVGPVNVEIVGSFPTVVTGYGYMLP